MWRGLQGSESHSLRQALTFLVRQVNRIDGARFLSKDHLAFFVRRDVTGSIDGLAVDLHPGPDFLHALHGLGGQFAVRLRPHVQQEIPAFAHNIDEQVDELVRGLVLIIRLERPLIAHR